ncbi:MAG TPA: hypothetical protein VK990_03660 [Acidimicrobiia bacterium]|nr:hypothetical protein [Acidimicrobiia bacterium]
MTDNQAPKGGAESSEARQRWLDEVQEALDRTGDAVRTAWEATRESRMSALESAKQAAQELGEVLDKGIAAAKERWAAGEQTGEPVAEPPAPGPEETPVTPPTRDVIITPVEDETVDQA